MTDPRHALGLAAEEAVSRWLTGRGWRVIAHRRRSPGGAEIDLVALDPADVLVALEVRARRTARAGSAAMSVDPRRVRRLRHSLATIASHGGDRHAGLRVDLVTAEPVEGLPAQWRLVRIPGIG